MDDAQIERRFGQVERDIVGLSSLANQLERYIREVSVPHHQKMNSFVDKFEAREGERDRIQAARHLENSAKIDLTNMKSSILLVVGTLGALICSICMLYLAVKASQHAEGDPAHIFHTPGRSQVYAGVNSQSTGEPVAANSNYVHDGR